MPTRSPLLSPECRARLRPYALAALGCAALVLALDLLTVLAMGFVGTIAIRTGLYLYLDIAIALALLGFLATIALARYILVRGQKGQDVTGEAGR